MMAEHNTKRCSIQEFHDLIVCAICNGYIIDPTTVDYCYHTFCRSCILKHLLRDAYCPQCKSICGKQINEANLKSDEILRSVIYKLVPGLYQRECNERSAHRDEEIQDSSDVEDPGLEFFSPAEPISLSLEYHPTLSKHCGDNQTPPVRYLQCPASVKIHHLKRFLCSKYDIDPENEQIEIEVIYEDEVLPHDFSLMDVGYCFNWQRHAPMAFHYRILLYDNVESSKQKNQAKVKQEIKSTKTAIVKLEKPNSTSTSNTTSTKSNSHTKAVTFALDDSLNKSENKTLMKTPVYSSGSSDGGDAKMLTGSRRYAEGKKSSGKRVAWNESSLALNNDFKSLRSNDVRYSDYGSVASTMNVATTTTTTAEKSKVTSYAKTKKCDIVVSIPQSQLSNSSYTEDEDFELKTAERKKKSNVPKNLPKLKIELSSMKAKLMNVPKPKSADACLEETNAGRLTKRSKSIVEEVPLPTTASQLDIQTYAKNIGLKPIDALTPVETSDLNEKSKYSPSASPMSSCSSSTNSSSNGQLTMSTNTATMVDINNSSMSSPSSSSHRKRKKKHSKDSNGKRKKLHAEISSQTDGKMKVKITSSTHKAHKLQVKRSHSVGGGERFSSSSSAVELESVALNKLKLLETVATMNESESLKALNRTLGEEARSINSLMHSSSMSLLSSSLTQSSLKSDSDKQEDDCKTNNMNENVNYKSKSFESSNEFKHTSSPPLPPSLFKTTPLAFTALQTQSSSGGGGQTTGNATASQLKGNTLKSTEWSKTQPISIPTMTAPQVKSTTATNSRLPTPSPPAPSVKTSVAHFVVPNPPRSIDAHPMQRYLSTPSSIASSANKNAGLQIKRSLSLDEHSTQQQRTNLSKQPRFEHERYGSMAQRKPVGPAPKCPKSVASKQSPVQVFGPDVSQCISMAQTPISSGSVTITARPRITTTQSQQQQQQQQQQSQMHNFTFPYVSGMAGGPYNKPALEIVRITPNQLPTDKQPLPSLNPPSSNRLMGPPIGFMKAKKTQAQAQQASTSSPTQTITQGTTPTIVKSPPLPIAASYLSSANSAYRTSLPTLINLRNTIPFPFPSKSSTSTVASVAAAASPSPSVLSFGEMNSKRPASTGVSSSAFVAAAVALAASAAGCKTNGTAMPDRSKTSLRDFRPTSKDGSVDILDLSASRNTETKPKQEATAKNASLANTNTNTKKTTTTTSTITTTAGTTNTTKKSLSTTTATTTMAPTKPQSIATNSLEAALNKIKQNISASNLSGAGGSVVGGSSSVEAASEDLQNLHMLSESATAREKITIKSSNIFDAKPKPQSSSMVRQQNASVRNIPNPSVLAFRNQTTLPITMATSKSSGNVVITTSSSITGSSIMTSSSSRTGLPITTSAYSAIKNNNNNSINTTNNSSLPQATSPRATKKVTTIDQVAANLNIRAAAAEASAAKNANTDEQVSANTNRKITNSIGTSSTSVATTETKNVVTSVVPVTTLSETKAKPSVVNISTTDTLTTVASSA